MAGTSHEIAPCARYADTWIIALLQAMRLHLTRIITAMILQVRDFLGGDAVSFAIKPSAAHNVGTRHNAASRSRERYSPKKELSF